VRIVNSEKVIVLDCSQTWEDMKTKRAADIVIESGLMTPHSKDFAINSYLRRVYQDDYTSEMKRDPNINPMTPSTRLYPPQTHSYFYLPSIISAPVQ
jgi:hypothetical protein